jgi:hypothetical protein
MARPKATDPKRPVSLSLRASTIERIEALTNGDSIGRYLSDAIERSYTPERIAARVPRPRPTEVTPRFKK